MVLVFSEIVQEEQDEYVLERKARVIMSLNQVPAVCELFDKIKERLAQVAAAQED